MVSARDVDEYLRGVREPKRGTLEKLRATILEIVPEAEQVILAGSFNGWEKGATTLKRDAKGIWKTQVSLEPGRYEYRFRVDGHWRDDPECPSRIPNNFGSENCIIEV